MRASRTVIVGLLLLALGGCVTPLQRSVPEATLVAEGRWRLVPTIVLPEVRGVAGCGAQALAAVLAHHDPALEPAALADELPWHDEGATPVDLLLEARARGFVARIERGSMAGIASAVAARRPLLVMLDAAPEVRTLTMRLPTSRVMHWAVVSGIADDGTRVLLAAERRRHHVVPWDDFERRWDVADRCAIEVRRADEGATAKP